MNTKNEMLRNRYIISNEMKSKLIKEIGACENCNYSDFLEILELAHIVHGHEPEKINRENVFLLCPNCHRAFDRGLLEIKGEVSDCHLVKYKSPFVLLKATDKVKQLKKKLSKSNKVWKRTGDGKFYLGNK